MTATSSKDTSNVDVVVVGAGLCGLATALALVTAEPRLHVKILERKSTLSDGPGQSGIVWLEPNGLRAAKCIKKSLYNRTVKHSARVRGFQLINHTTGSLEALHCDKSFRFRLNKPKWHRSTLAATGKEELKQELLAQLPADTVLWSCNCHDVELNDEGLVLQVEGLEHRQFSAKFCIACDGPLSNIRKKILADGEPFFDDTLVWRGRLPGDDSSTTPSLYGALCCAPGLVFLSHPLGGGDVAWELYADGRALSNRGFAYSAPEQRVILIDGKAEHMDDYQLLLELVSDLPDLVVQMVRQTAAAAVSMTPMLVRPAQHLPLAMGQGSLAIAGSAAHPLRSLSQSSNQALEDAADLGTAVMRWGMTKRALRTFEQSRHSRWRQVMQVTQAQAALSYGGCALSQCLLEQQQDLHRHLFYPVWSRKYWATLAQHLARLGGVLFCLAAVVKYGPEIVKCLMRSRQPEDINFFGLEVPVPWNAGDQEPTERPPGVDEIHGDDVFEKKGSGGGAQSFLMSAGFRMLGNSMKSTAKSVTSQLAKMLGAF